MNFIDKEIGNYRVVAAINSGAYGNVYRANHLHLDRIVAVKLLHAYLDSDKERKKVLQEARLLEQLNHRYILPILDMGFTDGMPYIVLEYAPGGSLRDRLKQQAGRLLPAEEARRLLMQVGQALEHAHQQNIIHRDLKPENILFNAQGEALLSDFGIATVVDTSMRQTGIIGTPTYMAPEQFHGMVSKEGDQYALGCLAYELYTGRKVFEVTALEALALQHTTKAPIPPTRYNPQLPGHIEQAILRALAKKRTGRYPGISDFLHALSNTREEEQSVPPTMPSLVIPQENWLSEGEAHLRLNRPKEALAVFERMLQFATANVAAPVGKGKSLSALERYKEAEQAFQEIVRLEPGNPSHRKVLEEVRARLKQDEEARSRSKTKEKEQTSSKKSTAQEPPNRAASLYKQGNTLTTSKQYEQALVAYREAVQLEPGNATYQQALGRTLFSLKRYEEALGAFKEAARLAPKVLDHLQMQAESMWELKRYQEALAMYEQAISLEPRPAYSKRLEELRAQLKQIEKTRSQNRTKEKEQTSSRKSTAQEPPRRASRRRPKKQRAQLKQQETGLQKFLNFFRNQRF
jgi:serine/threonine protein kinase